MWLYCNLLGFERLPCSSTKTSALLSTRGKAKGCIAGNQEHLTKKRVMQWCPQTGAWTKSGTASMERTNWMSVKKSAGIAEFTNRTNLGGACLPFHWIPSSTNSATSESQQLPNSTSRATKEQKVPRALKKRRDTKTKALSR